MNDLSAQNSHASFFCVPDYISFHFYFCDFGTKLKCHVPAAEAKRGRGRGRGVKRGRGDSRGKAMPRPAAAPALVARMRVKGGVKNVWNQAVQKERLLELPNAAKPLEHILKTKKSYTLKDPSKKSDSTIGVLLYCRTFYVSRCAETSPELNEKYPVNTYGSAFID